MAGCLGQLTELEEQVRDRWLAPAVDLLATVITADRLTLLRLLLALAAGLLWAWGAPLAPVVWVLAAAALTDLVDGPLARARGTASAQGGRLDQLADASLATTMGIMALAEGLLDETLLAALVLSQAAAWAAGRMRSGRWVDRPTTLARLQFVLVVSGFWVSLLGAVLRHGRLVALGRGLLYAEVAVALAMAALRLGGLYPDRPL